MKIPITNAFYRMGRGRIEPALNIEDSPPTRRAPVTNWATPAHDADSIDEDVAPTTTAPHSPSSQAAYRVNEADGALDITVKLSRPCR